ncbi:MAG: dissimilatory sulfite reductase D family protein [Clostridiales bacterium]|nr:dissimilatory sulfite reductase D family protein [Clostridiales bacterium]MCF8022508.1 dissimilatory sulfite reductase D family protein [Clostridiales bacterium]
MSTEDYKQVILDHATNSKKTKLYFSDLKKAVQKQYPDAKTRMVKQAATELINDGTMIYYSTGSTTMYGLKGRGITEDQ